MADDKKPTPPVKPIAKRKDKPAKVDKKVEKKTQKEVISTNKNLDSLISATKGGSSAAEKKADAIVKINEGQLKIDELRATGEAKSADKMQKALDASVKLLAGSKNNASLENRIKELTAVESQSANLLKLQTTLSDEENKSNVEGLEGIVKKLGEQSKLLTDDTANIELGKKLISLEGAFGIASTKETQELKEAYDVASESLKTALEAGDERGAELAQAQLDAIGKGAEGEENRRESNKLNEEANSRLFQIASGMESLGDKYDESAGAAARGAGFLAGLVGLALMFVDPETFNEVMEKVINSVTGIFDTIYAFFTGDWEGFTQGFSDNWKAIGGLFLGIVAMFGGKMLSALGKALKVARVFRIFMMGTMLPTLGAMFTGMITALTPIVVAMAPILLPILAIMALVGGLYFGFKKLQGALGPGAGIMDTLKVAMLYFVDFLSMIVNGVTFIPRKIIGMLGPRLAKWLMGDDFDTSVIDNLAGGLKTDRGATAAADIKKKNEEAMVEKAIQDNTDADMQKMLEGKTPDLESQIEPATTIPGDNILAMSDDNLAGSKNAGTSVQAVITNATGGTSNTNNVIQSTVVNQPITRATNIMSSAFSR